MAALRRGLGKPPGSDAQVSRYVIPLLPSDCSGWREEAYYTLATLFAYWHQGDRVTPPQPPKSLAASYARLRSHEDQAEGSQDAVERRFVALLNCHAENLPDHLRRAVGLLRSHEIPIDWSQLLHDIQSWGSPYRKVQRQWARHFWAPKQVSDPENSNTANQAEQPDAS